MRWRSRRGESVGGARARARPFHVTVQDGRRVAVAFVETAASIATVVKVAGIENPSDNFTKYVFL